MGLTDLQVKKMAPHKRRYEILDGKGLYIRVMPSGTKSWIFRYLFDGRPRRMTLGGYPGVTLAAAREKHALAMQDDIAVSILGNWRRLPRPNARWHRTLRTCSKNTGRLSFGKQSLARKEAAGRKGRSFRVGPRKGGGYYTPRCGSVVGSGARQGAG